MLALCSQYENRTYTQHWLFLPLFSCSVARPSWKSVSAGYVGHSRQPSSRIDNPYRQLKSLLWIRKLTWNTWPSSQAALPDIASFLHLFDPHTGHALAFAIAIGYMGEVNRHDRGGHVKWRMNWDKYQRIGINTLTRGVSGPPLCCAWDANISCSLCLYPRLVYLYHTLYTNTYTTMAKIKKRGDAGA
jgi:hypothetical protein